LALIIDITIVADNWDMRDSYQRKVDYHKQKEITNWIKEYTQANEIDYGAFVVNWRALQCVRNYI